MSKKTTDPRSAVFPASRFQATKWSSAEDKAAFLANLAGFVQSGFKRGRFTKSLYRRLSLTFGHIAHYDIHGFYATWFATGEDQRRWLRHVREYRPCGDPQWTFSDAERAFQEWLGAK
jgi:hypothetical protein